MYPPPYVLLLPVDVHVLFSFHSFCYNVVRVKKKDRQTGRENGPAGRRDDFIIRETKLTTGLN
jgi:hypothetical protein